MQILLAKLVPNASGAETSSLNIVRKLIKPQRCKWRYKIYMKIMSQAEVLTGVARFITIPVHHCPREHFLLNYLHLASVSN